jgi:hypothetical protein
LDNKIPDDFVFPSPRGLRIDDRMLERRVIKPVLKKLGLDDRWVWMIDGYLRLLFSFIYLTNVNQFFTARR